jgi:hypothetical protein
MLELQANSKSILNPMGLALQTWSYWLKALEIIGYLHKKFTT